jgi:hypothetical protein
MRHAWERKEKCTLFFWESPRESDHSQGQDTDGIKMDLGKANGGCAEWIQLAQDRGQLQVL